MKTEYKRDLQNNYLILEAPNVDEEDHYGLRMAEQNQVKGLLPVHESRRDGKLYLHYEITSKQTLESAYGKKVMGYQDILSILSGIRDTLEDMRKYLLSPQQLLFAPELIYVKPDRKELLLCYYVGEGECPIRMLAEFILKRLDHRDRQAVALGYGFFERASGENFSLAETLKEILLTFGGSENIPAKPGNVNSGAAAEPRGSYRGEAVSEPSVGYRGEAVSEPSVGYRGGALPESSVGYRDGSAPVSFDGYHGGTVSEASDVHRREGCQYEHQEEYPGYDAREELHVIHRERNRKENIDERNGNREKAARLTDRIFTRIHPAILLSFLALTVLLEILIICGMLSLTESGGCFFLILSVEILLNRKLLHKKRTEREEWDEEDEEEYQRMLQEVYREEPSALDPEPIEETRCLIPKAEASVFCLTCLSDNEKEKVPYPDIHPKRDPVYIGKIKGDADILLNVSTVSRMHAQIQMRQGHCFLKDMNSKNGTFVNGRRLEPQEECELQEGDTAAFAQIEYRVIKKNGIY